ncbi:hypothetical protein GCM10010919_31150 [Alishewanella longhuensis]|uniref:N-acetyltransferase domain-containing protein n=1 Tax=Alishewanella longhuensis TaxID=1091037 RepID=A0ABQ3L2G3_9ALTE|nr:GNAT family N-acetyltransferase [Alishewanella longhuensis]GHG76354.1 hypothetical protein GCM10010919_31150 [Alishewanella longhuensis]
MQPASAVLTLTPVTVAAEPIFIALFSCPQVMQHIQPPLSGKEAALRLQQILQQTQGPAYFLVQHRPSQQAIGLAMLYKIPGQAEAELGRMLLPNWQKLGLGTYLSQLLIETAKQDSSLQRVTKRIHHANAAAIVSAQKLGFVQQQTLADGLLCFTLDLYATA